MDSGSDDGWKVNADANRVQFIFLIAPIKLSNLLVEIYLALWKYNHTWIHSALKMPPSVFAEKMAA